jgi:hypothetical protein
MEIQWRTDAKLERATRGLGQKTNEGAPHSHLLRDSPFLHLQQAHLLWLIYS